MNEEYVKGTQSEERERDRERRRKRGTKREKEERDERVVETTKPRGDLAIYREKFSRSKSTFQSN